MKKLFTFVVVVALLCIALVVFFKDIIAKQTITTAVTVLTGLKVEIGKLKINLFETSVRIDDLKIYDTPEFKNALMVDMPTVFLAFNLGDIAKNKLYFKKIAIVLNELVVERSAQGKLNIESLKALQQQGKGPAPAFKIAELELKVGKAVYKEPNRGINREFPINLDERYKDIQSPEAFVKLIVSRVLMSTDISKLAQFSLESISGSVEGLLEQNIKNAKRGIEDSVKKTVDSVTSGIKNILPK